MIVPVAANMGWHEWLNARIPGLGLPPSPCLLVMRDGVVGSVVAFHNWDAAGRYLQMTIASEQPRWLGLPLIHAIAHHAFVVSGANVLYCDTETGSLPARILKRLGFDENPIPAMCRTICTMTADGWSASKIGARHGTEAQSTRAA